MSKTNITNGPWESQLTRIYGGNKLLFTGDWWDSPEELEQAEANASLAAAAPEMYALLLDIVTDYQCMPNPAVMADKIEAVLKKARGEE